VIGQSLDRYRISAAIGARGVGKVCRATETKLDRDVAIKIVPEGVAAPERAEKHRKGQS
jgi:serine/threonine protein kinase